MNDPIPRRQFMKQTGAASLSLGLDSYLGASGNAQAQDKVAPARKIGPNDKLTAAVIGTNGRGLAHIGALTSLPGVEIAYICDVDDKALAKGIKECRKHQSQEPKGLKDFRRALEDKLLD